VFWIISVQFDLRNTLPKLSPFLLGHPVYWLESPGFLKEVAPDVVRTVPLCGNLQNMFLKHSPTSRLRQFTNTFCHTPGLTHATPQLRLRWDWSMFAAAHFKPGDVRFSVR